MRRHQECVASLAQLRTLTPVDSVMPTRVRKALVWGMSAGLLALGVSTPSANASEVHAALLNCDKSGCNYTLVFAAGAGEANNVSVTGDAVALTLVDDGATLTAGSGCVSVGPNTARCDQYRGCPTCPPDGLYWAHIDLGDGNDRLRVPGVTETTVTAGSGDDDVAIQSGPINGGGGRDTLEGDGRTVIADGDNGSPAAPFDADTLVGAGKSTIVDYQTRTQPVDVDLVAGRGGQGNENDRLTGVTGALGGTGPDDLRGDAGPNVLIGMAGNDHVTGREGDDQLGGGSGADLLDGGDGNDNFRPSGANGYPQSAGEPADPPDTVVCGDGNDFVNEVDGDRLASDCERVFWRTTTIQTFRLSARLRALSASILSVRAYDCPQRRSQLILTVRLRTPAGNIAAGTLLGRRIVTCRKHFGFKNAALHLSPSGQHLLRHAHELPVVIAAKERNPNLFHPKRWWIERNELTTDLVLAST